MPEYLIVSFPEKRKVVVDGVPQGETDQMFRTETGTRTITLDPSRGCQPAKQVVVLVGTSPTQPHRVTFKRAS